MASFYSDISSLLENQISADLQRPGQRLIHIVVLEIRQAPAKGERRNLRRQGPVAFVPLPAFLGEDNGDSISNDF